MARILWVSDAGTPTGFGKVTHQIGERLVAMGHDVHCLAIGWDAKYPVDSPLKLYRAEAGPASSYLGYDRMLDMLRTVEPDIVVTVEDAPQLRKRLLENRWDPDQVLLRRQPVLAYLPVDGYNIPPTHQQLAQLVNVVAMTEFGAGQLGITDWIGHGVDADVFHPVDEDHPVTTRSGVVKSKAECRELFDIPQGAFVIGRVDTNSGRKDWGSTWKVIDTAYRLGVDTDTTLSAFHTMISAPGHGVDIGALVTKGVGNYMVTNQTDWPVGDVVAFMNTFDVGLTTSRGEGWGFFGAELLACGIPLIATDCSAFPEVTGPGSVLVPGKAYMTNPYGVDLVLADTAAMAAQVKWLAQSPERRRELGRLGMEHVRKNHSWDRTALWFHNRIEALVGAAQAAREAEADTGG